MYSDFIIFAAAYLLGSINFSIILIRLIKKEDLRKFSSGNPGVTNVYRMAGYWWAGVVLLFDTGRAIGVSAIAVSFLDLQLVPWAGFTLVLGNRYPCFHRFSGGKGVANYLGFTAFISPLTAVLSALNWVIIHRITGRPFIASFVMVFILSTGTGIKTGMNIISMGGILATAFFIFLNHRKNLEEFISRKI